MTHPEPSSCGLSQGRTCPKSPALSLQAGLRTAGHFPPTVVLSAFSVTASLFDVSSVDVFPYKKLLKPSQRELRHGHYLPVELCSSWQYADTEGAPEAGGVQLVPCPSSTQCRA